MVAVTEVRPRAPVPGQDAAAGSPSSGRPLSTWVRRGRWTLSLAVLAGIYGIGQLGMRGVGLGWDESIYFSQVTPNVPAAFFNAPRARGITWLAAPLAHVTPAVPDLRLYLTLASATALFLVYRVWFRVLPPAAVLTAAGAFASLWLTRFYGAELMPNLWVAFGLVLGVGGFLRVARDRRDRVGLACLPAGLAVAALMRPTDAAWVTAVLLGCALLVGAWRRNLLLLGLTAAGPALGCVPWVVEAEQRFGGVPARLRAASAVQGGLGWHPEVLGQHLRTIHGPLLCRPCTPPAHQPAGSLWLLAVPVAVAVLLLAGAARRRRVAAGAVLPAVAGAAIAVPYLLLVGYSAPRFLLPALGLLALPVGAAARTVVTTVWQAPVTGCRRAGPALLLLTLIGLGGAHLAAQQSVLAAQAASSTRSTAAYAAVAASLRRDGVSGPCVVSGLRSPQIAFYTRCASRNVSGHDTSTTPAALLAAAPHEAVVTVVEPGRPVPRYARHWLPRTIAVPGRKAPWTALTPPGGSLTWPVN